jgi:DNA recombination protein RmuC
MWLIILSIGLVFLALTVLLFIGYNSLQDKLKNSNSEFREFLIKNIFSENKENLNDIRTLVQDNLFGFKNMINNNFSSQQNTINKQLDNVQKALNTQLNEIRTKVESSLIENLQKNHDVYADITKRLSLIDNAQKNISELSTNVVSLQSILSDKQSRGLFGEVQLNNIVKNILPSSSYSLQHALPNGKRADCMIILPDPVGNLVIDAKFPLENYKSSIDITATIIDRNIAIKQFKKDLKKHIDDVANKYIVTNHTADMAMMFIPAESVFAEIHAEHQDIVNYAQEKRVWITSPATTMAVLNTFSAVIKDVKRQQEIKVIQEHLNMLAKDFFRFTQRMDNLSRHIKQANDDVEAVNASAKKISSRFSKIEKAELPEAVVNESDDVTSLID